MHTKKLHLAATYFQLKKKEKRKKIERRRKKKEEATETHGWVSPAVGLRDPRFGFSLVLPSGGFGFFFGF
jgi:hypothetical protein